MFRKTVIAGLAVLAPAIGLAAEPAPAEATPPPTPEHTITGNVGLFSQYIFRGLTQTNRNPAVQGGFDYAHSSGFYA
ncbi:MAG: TorF family putative porin, partial [Burkholderiales bacterium]